MPHGQALVDQVLLDLRRELEQPQVVRDARAVETDAPARLFLRHALVIDQHPEGLGQLHRVEVGALHVLDQRHLHDLAVRRVEDDGRDLVETGEL